jgi:hypothetical protein
LIISCCSKCCEPPSIPEKYGVGSRALRMRPEALVILHEVLEIVSHTRIRLALREVKNDLLGRAAHRIQEFVMGLQVVHL